MGSKDE